MTKGKQELRCLLVGDPHFQVKNLEEITIFVSEVEKWLIAHPELDYVIILGDVLHNHEQIYTFPLNSAIKFFEMCIRYKPTYVLVGNHDMTSNTVFLEPHHWMNSFKRWDSMTIVDIPTIIEDVIVAIPYVPNGRMIEALNHIPDWKEKKLIIGHQLLNGAKMGAIVENNVEEWEDTYPMCISGHIHDKQWVKPNLFYSGSSMQHAFGESHDKSLTYVTIDLINKEVPLVIEEVFLNIKLKEIVHVTVDELIMIMEKEKQDQAAGKKTNIDKKLVIKDDPNKIAMMKQSSVFQELEKSKLFSRIQCKTQGDKKDIDPEELSGCSYEHLLMSAVVTQDDPYLLSFAKHIMYGTDDVSNQDVIFFSEPIDMQELERLRQE